MKIRVQLLIPLTLVFLVGGLLGIGVGWIHDDTTEQLRKLEEAFLIITRHYVEDVDPADLAETAIDAMLSSLDPHSSYINAEAFTEVAESYRGAFGGIGIWFEIPDRDTAQVVSPIEGGPSEAAGLRAGDRIIAVDDTSVVGADDDEVKRRLKGPVGTTVQVTLKRLGLPNPFTVTITRDLIPLYSVTSHYMVDKSTGYVKISRFAQSTYQEFVEAVAELKGLGMKRLLLDLRDNPGGIMGVAVAIVDELLAGDGLIVYTEGRSTPQELFRAGREGIFETQPIMVLVNRNSVSASEIVAGALQDHDRALIVGQRTYGKGLVQNQFPLPDESRLQMTTARYFTPSGRLIQTPYEEGHREEYLEIKYESMVKAMRDPARYAESIPDSLKHTTTHGRTVFGGGGILPDYTIYGDTAMVPLMVAMYDGALFLSFRSWFEQNEQMLRSSWEDRFEIFMADFKFQDDYWDGFWLSASKAELPILIVKELPDPASLRFSATDLDVGRETLELYFKALLARQLYGARAAYPLFNRVDPAFMESLSLWEQAHELALLRQ
ncbi:MAG: S41 family peptidase [Bacteroidota bacterium]|nr:S41 family peptidase [Bacteroidota bacterium]MDE2956892.1 S41 family peptidase [Bacteroidota bacterium]